MLQPGVLHGFGFGPSANYKWAPIIEVSPLEPALGDGTSIRSTTEPESDGSSWIDVLRVILLGASTPVRANIRMYSVWTNPIVAEFDTSLQPAVLHTFSLGNSAANRGYVVEVSPLSTAGGAHITSSVESECDGTVWNDVLHVQLFNASGPVSANVRVYAVGFALFSSFGPAHCWLRDTAVPADRLVLSATFTAPSDYDPLSQPLKFAVADPEVCGGAGGVFSRFSLPAGAFTAYQGGAVLQFPGSVTDEVAGTVLTALIRLIRQSADVIRLTMDIGSADFACLHGTHYPTLTTTLSVGNTNVSERPGFTRLSGGGLFSP